MNWITRIEVVVSCLCMAGMVIVIGMQVFNRYLLGSSLVWSEELGRYFFIWSVWVGCGYAMRENRHLQVTALAQFVGPGLRKSMDAFAQIMTLVFCGFTIIWGIQMIQFLVSTGQEAPALQIKMYWIFLALPVGMAFMAVRCLQNLYALFTGERESSLD